MIALDGVYTVGKSGKAKFHHAKASLEKEGLIIPDPKQPWLDLDFHDIPIGPHSGSRSLPLHHRSFIQSANPTELLPQTGTVFH